MKRTLLSVVALMLLAVPVVAWTQVAILQFIWPLFLSQLTWLMGVLGFVFLLFQFVLSSRLRIVERGVGLDRLFVAHRLSGIIGLSLVLVHAGARTLWEVIQNGAISLGTFKLIGVLAFIVAAVAGLAALTYKGLGLKYETWKRMHVANYLVLPAAFVHSLLIGAPTLGSLPWFRVYWWALMGIYVLVVVYRFARHFYIRAHPHTVAEVQPENHDVTSLFFSGPPLDHKPGQFMFVNVEINGKIWEQHPYTISSSPTSDRLRLSAKAIGDFSSAVGDTTAGATAFVDGPYGEFSFLNHHPASIVYLAGGIGITPFMSQLRYMRDKAVSIPTRLIWGNKTAADICFAKELDQLTRELPDFSYVHVMSHDPEWEGEKGFVTMDLINRHCTIDEHTHVYLCGPPIMMTTVTAAFKTTGFPMRRLHQERFAL